jgi:hypothetical protein
MSLMKQKSGQYLQHKSEYDFVLVLDEKYFIRFSMTVDNTYNDLK